MPWRIVILLFESGSISNILSFMLSMSGNNSKSSFHVKFFAGVTSSEAPSSLFSQQF